jgi:DNA-binding transcriptional ArsR family regulator
VTDASATALDALGDPSRRRLLAQLRSGEQTVRELTDASPVSQSAVSQHLRVLLDAGLVDVRAEGTRRLYRVDLDGLSVVRAYVDGFWDGVLDAFTAFADARDPTSEETSDDHRPRSARRPRPSAAG